MPFIELTKIERKRFFILIICLLSAIVAWLFLALKNKYVYHAKTILVYRNEPEKKAFRPLQSDTVFLQVEGTGWQLLFARLRINPQFITIDLNKLNNRDYLILSEQLAVINKQLETNQKIISIKPDTLYFDFSTRLRKRVVVKLLSNLSYVKQYNIANSITIFPKYINLVGPKEELDKITYWETDTLKLANLQHDTNIKVALKQNKLTNISLYPNVVSVKLPVEEFTEKIIEVPLKITNNLAFYDVKLYPKKVKIKFLVPLSQYQLINKNQIEAYVAISDWETLKVNKLNVKLNRFPAFCKLVSITPNKIDFLIEK